MRRKLMSLAACLGVVLPFNAGADAPTAGQVASFITCPVYRDVDQGLKSGCWLADDPVSGTRFDVSGGRSKPQWGREVLVEGLVSDEADACGGVVLKPVRVSVLPGLCNKHMLPAEGFPGRKFAMPAETMQQSWVPQPVPQPPFEQRTWDLYFDFNSSFPLYQYSEVMLLKIAAYIQASQPERVRVTGFAATTPYLVNGIPLVEDIAVAEERATKVGVALQRLGVESSRVAVSWQGDAQPTADGDEGLFEPSRRRVTIALE